MKRRPILPSSAPRPCAAVVVAAGSSSRMGGKVRKPYLKLRGRPILAWTVSRLARVPGLRQIVLVTRPEDRQRALRAARQARLPQRVALVCADGGARRQDSVFNGLRATSPEAEVVLIHDAARPFPQLPAMVQAIEAAAALGGAILAIPVRDTVKRQETPEAGRQDACATSSAAPCGSETGPRIATTVPRADLWLAQTPQVFRRGLILELFERLAREAPDAEVTDDAAVCERFGQPVLLIEASATNLKITRPEDLALAEGYLARKLV